MSKTIDAGLLAVYRSDFRTIADAVKITRRDGQVLRWISLDRDLTVYDEDDSPTTSEVYESAPGFEISSLVSTEGFAVDNAEFKVLDGDVITRADILAGIWNGATVELFQCDWAAAVPIKNVLKVGTLGKFKPMRGYCTVEFRDLRQAAQNAHDTVLQPTCRYELGDAKCTKDVSGAPFTMTGTVETVVSQYSVTDSARIEADDYFGDGYFTFTSGLNNGLTQKVKTFEAGVFVFWNQFIFAIGNDDYTVTAGCRFRRLEDCKTKFDNVINFGGEDNERNPDSLTAPAV